MESLRIITKVSFQILDDIDPGGEKDWIINREVANSYENALEIARKDIKNLSEKLIAGLDYRLNQSIGRSKKLTKTTSILKG